MHRSMILLPLLITLYHCSKDSSPVNSNTLINDTVPPVISIISPSSGATLDDVLQVSLSATDNVGVTRVEVFIDNETPPAATLTKPPWEVGMSIASRAAGQHFVRATAYDSAGNNASATVTFMKTTPPDFRILLKDGDVWRYNLWDLDSLDAVIPSTNRTYTTSVKTSGGLLLGGFNDWFYGIGYDAQNSERDTTHIRYDVQKKELMQYGYYHEVLESIATILASEFGTSLPAMPSSRWDIIAKYDLNVGQNWSIGPSTGHEVAIVVNGRPMTFTVTTTGAMESMNESIVINGRTSITRKTSTTTSITESGQKASGYES